MIYGLVKMPPTHSTYIWKCPQVADKAAQVTLLSLEGFLTSGELEFAPIAASAACNPDAWSSVQVMQFSADNTSWVK